MTFRPPCFSRIFQESLRAIACVVFLGGAVALRGDDSFLSKPPEEWTEDEAARVLEDSPWAHRITTTTQEFQCDFEHPVFPGMYSEEYARKAHFRELEIPASEVKPDGAEYVVQFLSVKPMQAAIARLLALDGEKWRDYGGGTVLTPGSPPSNPYEHHFNPGDEFAVSIILKKPGPGGASFRDYAFPHKGAEGEKAARTRFSPACGGIRTANGIGKWYLNGPVRDEEAYHPASFTVFYAGTVNGRPLITHPNEKVEFRYVADQRVFETTFYVDPKDLFDGTETILHEPTTIASPKP